MNFYMPVRLFTGKNCISNNSMLFPSFGKKCLIVTSGSAAKKSGALDDVLKVLNENDILYTVYDRIQQNPSITSCIEAGKTGYEFGAEFVIGIGGGSPLDAAKVVAASVSNPEIDAFGLYELKWPNKPVPVVLVGTTSGTGSEVTQISVITNLSGQKVGMKSDSLYAAAAFGDPRYTESMPLSVTASTCVDALCHCIESFLNKEANAISRGISIQGILNILPLLDKISKGELPSPSERAVLYDASILGGFAICITGTAAPHALGYLLSESYGVPHGFACACFLPSYLDYIGRVSPSLAEDFFARIGSTKPNLLKLLADIVPSYSFYLDDREIEEKAKRWSLNVRNIARTPGCCDQSVICSFLKAVFQ